MFRHLRGLRAQLLLWMILPLAVALIVLSLAGVVRHRQAMTTLVEERDKGLVVAQANQLAREIDRRAARLMQIALDLAEDDAALPNVVGSWENDFPAGLALVDEQARVLTSFGQAANWDGGTGADALR